MQLNMSPDDIIYLYGKKCLEVEGLNRVITNANRILTTPSYEQKVQQFGKYIEELG